MKNKRLRGVLSHRLFIILLLILQIAFFGYLILSGSQASWLVSLFFSLLSTLAAIHVVSKHERPGYKLTWVFTILSLPIFGGAFYLLMQLQPSVYRFRKQVESSQAALTRRLPRHEGRWQRPRHRARVRYGWRAIWKRGGLPGVSRRARGILPQRRNLL